MESFGALRRGTGAARESTDLAAATPGKRTLTEVLPAIGARPGDELSARPEAFTDEGGGGGPSTDGAPTGGGAPSGDRPRSGKDGDPPQPIVGNPLDGLQLGDGRMKYRTQLKGCVQQLKQKLIEKLGAPLLEREQIVLDPNSGEFDAVTLRAVHLFETERHLEPSGTRLSDFTAKELWYGDKQPPKLQPDKAGSGAELAGLRPGDGVQPPRNTEDFKRRVRLLQEKLRERVPAPALEINGEFLLANDTLLTYHKFQEQIGERPDNGKVSTTAADLLISGVKQAKDPKVDPSKPGKEKRHLTGIVGLTLGDGAGDQAHLKPYVRRLNELLDRKMQSHIQPSDVFGPETLQVLHDFQARYNQAAGQSDVVRDSDARLLDGASPQPSTFNPTLEDRLDQIWNAYHFTLMARRDGLIKLGNDLKTVQNKKETMLGLLTAKLGDAFTDALKDTITKATDAVTQYQITARRDQKVEDYDNADLTNVLVTSVFAGAAAGFAAGVAAQATWIALKSLWNAITGDDPEKLPPSAEVDAFIQSVIDGTTQQEYGAQKDFLGSPTGKQAYREQEARQPGSGLAEATKALAAVEASKDTAKAAAYNKTLDGWLVAHAQDKLGTRKRPGTEDGKQTDMGHREGELRDAPGVLQIHIKGRGPAEPLALETRDAEINGLSMPARQALEARPLAEMAIPVLARGKVHYVDFNTQDTIDFEIFLGKNEAGQLYWKDSEAVRRWLGWKASILSGGTDNSPEGGTARALGDLGDRRFKIKNGE